MTSNMGVADKIIRSMIGLTLLYLGFIDNDFINDQFIEYIFIAFGIFSLLVVIVGNCPMYSLIGISTLGKK